MSVLDLIRPELLNNKPYPPTQIQGQQRLHANELPWTPLEDYPVDLNFYPDSLMHQQVQEQLAKRYQVEANQLTLTRGSDDGIDLVMRLFLQAGQDAFMQLTPTFPMYAFYARLQQAELISCPLKESDQFTLSLDEIKDRWKPNCKMILLCSPNNPTSNLIALDLIAEICTFYAKRSVIVVDEAYIEFSKTPSAATLLSQFENLVILRTLSKASGLAGLRMGSILAQAPVIQAFNRIIAPYSISSVVLELAYQALLKEEWFPSAVRRIQTSRDWLINELNKNPMIEQVYPSEANFILIKTPEARALASWFAHSDIIIKTFPPESDLGSHLRITVGDLQQSQLLITALSTFNKRNS